MGQTPGSGGDRYVPYDERTGEESVVYFTKDLSPAGLQKLYQKVNAQIRGRVAIKLHTGEPEGPNIIPRPWVENLIREEIPDGVIVETNTYYDGGRYTTAQHRKTLEKNGWTFAPVDILDEDGTALLPVQGGKWFEEMSVGRNLLEYDSLVALTHFKGHAVGGFGGSNKNIGIGCADGRDGKKWIHTPEGTDDQWGIVEEEFMERMTESTKAVIDSFSPNVCYINVLRNMSVSCDCEGVAAEPVVTPNIGIVAGTDILAVDQASVDLVYALELGDKAALMNRIESRHGHRQLSYMKELGMGNDCYALLDADADDARITAADAVKGVIPFAEDDR